MPLDSHLNHNKLEAHLLVTSAHALILSIIKDRPLFNSWFPSSVVLLMAGKTKRDTKVFSTYPESFASSCTCSTEPLLFFNQTLALFCSKEYYQPTKLSNPLLLYRANKIRRFLDIQPMIGAASPIIQTLVVCGTTLLLPMMGRNS